MFRTRSSGLYRGMEISMLKSLFVAFAVLFVFQPVLVRAEEDANECMARYTRAAKTSASYTMERQIEKHGYAVCYEKEIASTPSTADEVSTLDLALSTSTTICALGLIILGLRSKKLSSAFEKADSAQKCMGVELQEAQKRIRVEVAKQDQLKATLDEISLRLKLSRALSKSTHRR